MAPLQDHQAAPPDPPPATPPAPENPAITTADLEFHFAQIRDDCDRLIYTITHPPVPPPAHLKGEW